MVEISVWRPWTEPFKFCDKNVLPQPLRYKPYPYDSKGDAKWQSTPTSRHHRPRRAIPQPDLPKPEPRFGTPLSVIELKEASKPFVPRQAQRNSDWSYNTFQTWYREHNAAVQSKELVFPKDLFTKQYPLEVLDKALSCFILEARRKDGQFYPGATVKNILSALFRVYKHNVGANNVTNFVELSLH